MTDNILFYDQDSSLRDLLSLHVVDSLFPRALLLLSSNYGDIEILVDTASIVNCITSY